MRSERFVALAILAALLLGAAAPARADHTARWWLVPGGQYLWPTTDLGLEEEALGPGAIIGWKWKRNWALEGRIHYNELAPRVGPGSKTKLLHGEGNLTFFLAPEERLSPYVTAGVGGVDASDGLDGQEFAWNGGIGALYHFNEKVSLRVDARNVSFRHPDTSSSEWLESHELFAGLSFGFGGAKAPSDGDSDHDGVSDRLDRCPNTPRGAKVDTHGCPSDSDGDGVYDGIDECPRTPEGARVDARGCPLDSDGDGVYDGLDRCPDTPRGTPVDRNGCPLSSKEKELIETGMIRLEKVYFDTAKSSIKRESHEVLDEVAGILNKYDDLKIEVGGHTDARGAASYNQTLSEARATAVLDYLVAKHNLSRARFSAKGYGESKPVAGNDTAAGMSRNRRVEFKVLNPEALKR